MDCRNHTGARTHRLDPMPEFLDLDLAVGLWARQCDAVKPTWLTRDEVYVVSVPRRDACPDTSVHE